MRTIQDLSRGVKLFLRPAKYFKALRQKSIFSFVFNELRRLKFRVWIKFNLRQVLSQRKSLMYSELCALGLKF
jgi:hypothetical protein